MSGSERSLRGISDQVSRTVREQMRKPATAKPRQYNGSTDRADLFREGEIRVDPTEAVRARLMKMWVMESAINDDLYGDPDPDPAALSASNKRLLDLSQALKALPSQSASTSVGAQVSLADAVKDALERRQSKPAADQTGMREKMLERADASFGEGSV